jgi:hypothetical protein
MLTYIYVLCFLQLFSLHKVNAYTCDCGVNWAVTTNGVSTLTQNITIYDYQYVVVIQQAMWTCYDDVTCDGVLFSQSLEFAYFYRNVATGVPSSGSPLLHNVPWYSTATVAAISRALGNRCDSMALDPFFYYFKSGYRTLIEAYAISQNLCDSSTHCAQAPNPATASDANLVTNAIWSALALIYWERVGHKLRQSPNADCLLSPPLWSDAVCSVPQVGCVVPDGSTIPCGTQGNCFPNPNALIGLYTTPFVCDCKNYTDGVFSDIPQYMGNACQYPTRTACSDDTGADATLICSGHPERCRPVRTASTLVIDYTPRCVCDATTRVGTWPPLLILSSTGQFCEINRCDADTSCNNGVCTFDTASSSWKCSCSAGYIGAKCEYSSASCRHPGDSSLCSSNGICIPPDHVGAVAGTTTNQNTTIPWCSCTVPFTAGKQCQIRVCDTSVVPRNRGTCAPDTGSFVSCYTPTFSTTPGSSVFCDRDECTLSNGTVDTTVLPPTCDCGQLEYSPVENCRPPCASLGGVQCGAAIGNDINICLHTSNGTEKYATCQCGSAFVKYVVPNVFPLSTTRLPNGQRSAAFACQPFCIHGVMLNVEDFADGVADGKCACNLGYSGVRCDTSVCGEHGVYDSDLHTCNCTSNYNPSTNCSTILLLNETESSSSSSSSSSSAGSSGDTNSSSSGVSDAPPSLTEPILTPLKNDNTRMSILSITGAGIGVILVSVIQTAMTAGSAVAGAVV